ncbi:poly [ADP-ribose] polymerase 1 [Pelobates fuscus]|uniref:poly [ADP-ribose] polymerase 1 n=1 Tax=Pelobates fuscus TaxID=191477 RepID=UPI002FE4C981
MAESADKLYRAEYAKSGRASCKKCSGNIAKETLRLAIMVQSPMFDGKVPHWHHYACFWKRARVVSHGDIDGFTELRWEDQEQIKKAIETGGATAASGGDAKGGKTEMTLIDFAAEYAKSNRSTCKGCNEKIEKGQVRISKKSVDVERPQLGMIDRWYHCDCFVSRRDELGFLSIYNATHMKGFKTLKDEDKDILKVKLPALKNEGKRKGDEIDGSGVSKKKIKKEEAKLEKLLKEQTEFVWGIKDELKKVCSTNDLKELLIANKQQVPSGETNILDRVADGMAFGALLPCEECNGQLVFKTDAYYCTGDISAWTKCVAKTQTPNRKDWVIPKEFHEVPYLKKFKSKRQDRAFPPPVAPIPASAPVSAKSEPAPIEIAPAGKPLTNMKILTLGKLSKNKDENKSLIEEMGGKVTGSANKATLCVSTAKELEKMSKKMEEVKAANIRVVSEEFLNELGSGKSIQDLMAQHGISAWGAEIKQEVTQEPPPKQKSSGVAAGKSTGKVKEEQGGSKLEKKMKLTVKGGAAIDPESGLENSCHVLEKNSKIFSATLGLVDITRGTNSYYKLQLIEHDRDARYWVFRSWGRVGTVIGSNKLEEMSSKEEAIDHFLNLYQEKTGNAWHSTNFTKYPNKFYPLEIDYGQEEEVVKKLSVDAGTKSKLPPPVQDLIKLIFDLESMKKAMVEFEIDLQKMPLGKLSKRQIQSAYSILNEVQQAVSDNAGEARLLDLSNRFYTLIPHDFGMKKPPLLNNSDYIQAKVQMLDNLLDIEVAYSLLMGGTDDGEKDPIDVKYEKLKTDIKVVDKDSEEAKIIHQYVKNTHAETHNNYELEIVDIFKIDREGERQRYKPFKQLHNRQLLWHGSRTTNFAGILSQGLRIAPPEAPVTGYMFGKGIYFADMVSKSANYCHAMPGNPLGLLLLGEVALGNMHELANATHITKLPKGKHSVKGIGGTAPDPSATVQLDGVDVPLGKGVFSKTDARLLYNEYIVYDVAQVHLKYLLKLKFNYRGGMLW